MSALDSSVHSLLFPELLLVVESFHLFKYYPRIHLQWCLINENMHLPSILIDSVKWLVFHGFFEPQSYR